MIFETHCHLNDEVFKDDLDEVLLRAKNNNVTSMCIIAWDKDSSINAINICKKYQDCGITLQHGRDYSCSSESEYLIFVS